MVEKSPIENIDRIIDRWEVLLKVSRREIESTFGILLVKDTLECLKKLQKIETL